MHCEGKCHMKKELKQEQDNENSSQNSMQLKLSLIQWYFVEPISSWIFQSHFNLLGFRFLQHEPDEPGFRFFQPPRA